MKHCSIDGCTKNYLARGCCSTHYAIWRKYGDARYPIKKYAKHGLSYHPLYQRWLGLKDRTHNTKSHWYPAYGGRGIKVCNRWNEAFMNFYEDVGEPPSLLHSVDRIDNDGHYSCGKCEDCLFNNWPMNIRWGTKVQQSLNQRLSKRNTTGYRGVTFRYGKYAAHISYQGIQIRLGSYGTAEEAAHVYDSVAYQLHGKDANVNSIVH